MRHYELDLAENEGVNDAYEYLTVAYQLREIIAGDIVAEALRPAMRPVEALKEAVSAGLYGPLRWPNLTTFERKPTGLLAVPHFVEAIDEARRAGDSEAIPYLLAATAHTISGDAIGYVAERLNKKRDDKRIHPADRFPDLVIEAPGHLDDEPSFRTIPKWELGHGAYSDGIFRRVRGIARNYQKLAAVRCESLDATDEEKRDTFANIPDGNERATPWDALEELDDADRVVVEALRYGRSVAQTLGVTERQARNRINRAETNLRKILDYVS
ncbi:hypothetical protein LF1_48620 [Rubripirellula obstinata]|uniref:Uncharacterized protein n=1 Tax=Rubripirellula obstinata TaxID=406547 RepID=A0A5B1CMK6_9BACT|nr:sigma-70 family RNA polymerase sigma factor [Rubripirellula obstinata]KAA1262298.1 hypothetical protein LF1_48620 [Rubripirellula obstinata]